ncbi:hypothetical protein CKA54_04145 [Campylobacter sp. P255]|nr:hypothetical protein CKA54_04145 [Campylobacter sp. P255]
MFQFLQKDIFTKGYFYKRIFLQKDIFTKGYFYKRIFLQKDIFTKGYFYKRIFLHHKHLEKFQGVLDFFTIAIISLHFVALH